MKNIFINTALLVFSIVFALLISELVLAALNFEPAYNINIPQTSPREVREECLADSIQDMVERGMITSVLGIVRPDKDLGYTYHIEPHAFPDHRHFYRNHRNHIRVLVLGDSYTAGFAADAGKGYVDLLARYYQHKGVAFFNTGTAGYAQNNQLAVLEKYTDLIKPHLVLLGFFPANDFTDNLAPLDRFTVFPGTHTLVPGIWIRNYETISVDGYVSVRRRSPDEMLRIYQRRVLGCDISTRQGKQNLKDFLREEVFYRTRIGTRIYFLLHKAKHMLEPVAREKGREIDDRKKIVTEDYVLRMKQYLDARKIPFYVLLIPYPLKSNGRFERTGYYDEAIRLLQNHSIPYVDPFEKLILEDYALADNDTHWNNSGHFKAYEVIRDYFGKDLEVHLRNRDASH